MREKEQHHSSMMSLPRQLEEILWKSSLPLLRSNIAGIICDAPVMPVVPNDVKQKLESHTIPATTRGRPADALCTGHVRRWSTPVHRDPLRHHRGQGVSGTCAALLSPGTSHRSASQANWLRRHGHSGWHSDACRAVYSAA